MNFGMAIPRQLLKPLSPLCDYDFVLAHELEDKNVMAYYKDNAKSGRIVLMDNGFHERGVAMTAMELRDYINHIEPDFVVCPDKLGDADATYKGYEDMKRVLPGDKKTRLAVCIQGADPTERLNLFQNVRQFASMICFPFRENRLEWFVDIIERIPQYMPIPPRIHLLGVSSLSELRQWREVLHRYHIPHARVSVDTTKPIKFGLTETLINDETALRGKGGWPTEPVKATTISDKQLAAIYYNVAYLRRSL